MPWHIEKSGRCPDGKPWAVIKNADDSVAGCHPTKQRAQDHMAALYANEQQEAARPMADNPKQPYGDVPYADPGYQKDGKKRYPIDTAAHVKAAWSYINQSDNAAQYTSEQLAAIKGRIKAAAKKFGIEISSDQQNSVTPAYDFCVRSMPLIEFREAAAEDSRPIMSGHFAVFNRWTEIDSAWEGQFMESIAPGAFKKTFANFRNKMRVLFQHGKDPSLGDQLLGQIQVLEEDDHGARYEVLLNRGIPELVMDGLRNGQYGASFRFRVPDGGDKWNYSAKRSEDNPEALPERVVTEAHVFEFGPVTFPAYHDATATVRSLTDEYVMERLAQDPTRFRELLERFSPAAALSRGHDESHSSPETRDRPRSWTPVSIEEFVNLGRR